jgi:Ca2+/Na+ antiporter
MLPMICGCTMILKASLPQLMKLMKHHDQTGLIIGVVIGGVLFIAAAVLLLVFVVFKKRRDKKNTGNNSLEYMSNHS